MSSPSDPTPAETGPSLAPVRSNFFLRLFFGSDARIEPGPMRVLLLVSFGLAFESYDIGLVNAALPQIAPDLGSTPADMAYHLAAVRLGGLGTLLLVPLADRLGRRRIFLLALIGMSIGTLATGFSQTAVQFALLQMITRTFMLTAAALSIVILVEEFPADQRGSALGMVSVLGGMGYGLGAAVYAGVDVMPYGWRALYVAGVIPLALLPFFRRSLKETRRFEIHAEEMAEEQGSAWLAWLRPLVEFGRTHPRRALILGAAGFFGSTSSIAVFQYTSDFVQSSHGWVPGQYSMLVLGGGMIGIFGSVIGGRGSDRFGRRAVGCGFLALAPLFAFLFFEGPGAMLAVFWGFYVLCMAAGEVVIKAFSAELFPTSHRGTSSGVLVAIQSLGFATGLVAVGAGAEYFPLGRVVATVSLLSIVAAISVFFLPETTRRELETISGPGEG